MKRFLKIIMLFAVCCSLSGLYAEDYTAKVKDSMGLLKKKLNALGAPKIEGKKKVAGKDRPAMVFGSTVINANYDVVDAVKKEMGGTATVFVKDGDEFIRVSTNVMKDAETRAVGTPLAKNAAHEKILKKESFFGKVDILGSPYETGYEPIIDASGNVIGVYYVGYMTK